MNFKISEHACEQYLKRVVSTKKKKLVRQKINHNLRPQNIRKIQNVNNKTVTQKIIYTKDLIEFVFRVSYLSTTLVTVYKHKDESEMKRSMTKNHKRNSQHKGVKLSDKAPRSIRVA